MKDKLLYKQFIGSVHFSAEDEIFYGKIEGINDLITFEGETVNQLKSAFKNAVEDYVAHCKEVEKPIFKSFKGSFNVRIDPELHSMAFENATKLGKSLNQFVKEAIEEKIKMEH